MAKLDMVEVIRLNKPGYVNQGRYDVLLTKQSASGAVSQFIVGVKNPQGWPIDLKRYDNDFIYDQLTEGDRGWFDQNDVKIHTANGQRGMKICPRYVDSAFSQPIVTVNADSPFMSIKNGAWDFVPNSVGNTTFVLHPPTVRQWGGDVGNIPTFLIEYFWDGIKDREQYFFAPPFGLIKWTHATLVNGKDEYKIDNEPKISNTLQHVEKIKGAIGLDKYILPIMR